MKTWPLVVILFLVLLFLILVTIFVWLYTQTSQCALNARFWCWTDWSCPVLQANGTVGATSLSIVGEFYNSNIGNNCQLANGGCGAATCTCDWPTDGDNNSALGAVACSNPSGIQPGGDNHGACTLVSPAAPAAS